MGEEQEEPQPGAWRDRAGYLWLEASPGRVFCYDGTARRLMGGKWPVQPLGEADAEFGPLELLVPAAAPAPGPDADRIVFLYGGGMSAEVPASHPAVAGLGAPDGNFAEVVPGYRIALLSQGLYVMEDGDVRQGAFVIVRQARR